MAINTDKNVMVAFSRRLEAAALASVRTDNALMAANDALAKAKAAQRDAVDASDEARFDHDSLVEVQQAMEDLLDGSPVRKWRAI